MAGQLLITILISTGIGLFVFSTGLKTSIVKCQAFGEMMRTSLFLGSFQGLLFALGWAIPVSMFEWIYSFAKPLGILVIFLLGLKIIMVSQDKRRDTSGLNVSRLNILILLGIASGMNGFLAGLGIGLIGFDLIPAVFIIAGLSFITAVMGISTGKMAVNIKIAIWSEVAGGTIVFLTGLVLVMDYFRVLDIV